MLTRRKHGTHPLPKSIVKNSELEGRRTLARAIAVADIHPAGIDDSSLCPQGLWGTLVPCVEPPQIPVGCIWQGGDPGYTLVGCVRKSLGAGPTDDASSEILPWNGLSGTKRAIAVSNGRRFVRPTIDSNPACI